MMPLNCLQAWSLRVRQSKMSNKQKLPEGALSPLVNPADRYRPSPQWKQAMYSPRDQSEALDDLKRSFLISQGRPQSQHSPESPTMRTSRAHMNIHTLQENLPCARHQVLDRQVLDPRPVMMVREWAWGPQRHSTT